MPPRRTRNINDVYECIMARMEEQLDQSKQDEELGNPLFEGDCSSSNEWGDYGVASDDYEGAPVFDDDYKEAPVFNDDQFEEELMPVYDTDIKDFIEEEEGFVRKGGFGEEEENMEDVVVVANDLCSSMIQTTLSVDFSKTIDSNPHELIWSQKGNLVDVSILIGKKYQEGYLKAKPMDDKLGFKTIKGDGSSSDEWGYYGVAGNDYEGPPVFDDDQYEEESMPLYDTDIEDVIEEEEGFIGKGTFGGEEDNIEDVVVVANDLCSSMIQTTIQFVISLFHYISWYQEPKFLIKMPPRRSEGEESEYPFFEGDGSSSEKYP
ncbi:hypothetical protein Tco_0701964 [Tanacetum coccineum]|uniref:Uncharacterized protein n=1 Tax=Tanacetum coccineum TaxID=301880 RepID=A0ABQ4XWL5_9ASTR